MSKKKEEPLFAQIEAAKESVQRWPDWMKSIAYFSGTDPSTKQHAISDLENISSTDSRY
ncbi:MAG: hypothetical protein ACYCXP_04230 [Leptospirillum sp.]